MKTHIAGRNPGLQASFNKPRGCLGRKVMTNLDSIFKSRDITLSTKVHLVKAMVFTVVMYGLEKAVAPHFSTLAWKTLWTEKPGRLQSMGSLRVGHD